MTFWLSAAVLKQGPASFLLTIPTALATYLATWSGWLSTTGGFYRDWAEQPGNAWTGLLSWVPLVGVGEVWTIAPLLLAVAIILAAISSLVTLNRYTKV